MKKVLLCLTLLTVGCKNENTVQVKSNEQEVSLTKLITVKDYNRTYVDIVEIEGQKYIIVSGPYKAAICPVVKQFGR